MTRSDIEISRIGHHNINCWILKSLSRREFGEKKTISLFIKLKRNVKRPETKTTSAVLTLDYTASNKKVSEIEKKNEDIYIRNNILRLYKHDFSDCEMSSTDESYIDPDFVEKQIFDEPHGYDILGRPYGINQHDGSIVPLRTFPISEKYAGKEISTDDECYDIFDWQDFYEKQLH